MPSFISSTLLLQALYLSKCNARHERSAPDSCAATRKQAFVEPPGSGVWHPDDRQARTAHAALALKACQHSRLPRRGCRQTRDKICHCMAHARQGASSPHLFPLD